MWACLGHPESRKQHNIRCISNTVDAIHLEMENDALDLGTEFEFGLTELSDNRERYTVAQLITALEATTTLTELTVFGHRPFPDDIYAPRPPSNVQVVEPLCRCVANLRGQNKEHPLNAVKFHKVDSNTVRQFLVALKQFGISHVRFHSAHYFPVNILMDFCHDNSNLKVLELHDITFAYEDGSDLIGDSAAATLNLDTLDLFDVSFNTSFAATNFARLLARMRASALGLGAIYSKVEMDEYVEFDDYFDTEYDRSLHAVTKFKMASVEQLTFSPSCEIKHFRTALNAGMSTVIRLTVGLRSYIGDDDISTEKLKSLARMIRKAVKLKSLTIQTYDGELLSRPPRQLLQALEACPTVTEIHVNDYDVRRPLFPEPEVQQLRRITARNSELGQFVADPLTLPNDKMLTLMLQLNNCPSGLYMLTRRLPEIFSFQKGNCMFPLMVEPIPTRNLRKRRKNAYEE